MPATGPTIIDLPAILLQSDAAADAAGGSQTLGVAALVAAGLAAGAVLARAVARIPATPSGPMPRDPALGALAMLVFIAAGSIGATLAASLALGGADAEHARLARGATGNLAQAGCALGFLASTSLFPRARRPRMPSSRAFGEAVVAFVLVLPTVATIAIAVNALLLVLGQPTAPEVSHETLEIVRAKGEPLFTALTLAHVAILVPIAEEAGWRGLLQPAVRTGIRFLGGARADASAAAPILAVVATSALFTAVHWSVLPAEGRPAGLAMLLALGIVLGTLRERTGGLLAPIALHALFNAANLALALR